MKTIADIRKDYSLEKLDEKEVELVPMTQFEKWWHDVMNSSIVEPNAMTLATADAKNKPAARIVLLKGFNDDGFIFYTNYQSDKANDMEINPQVSLVFFWKEIERQVRVNGIATKLGTAENDAYFDSRPEASKIGAWASPQSKVIASREIIEKNAVEFHQKFSGIKINRPSHWGGYIVKPTAVEFWQGRPSRLHDRIRYTLQENSTWTKERLAP